jgi:4,5-dihydroxyphthalate decarboxylase
MARFQETAALSCMLPWSPAHDEEARSILGTDWWPYGVTANAATLGVFLRYSYEQGLAGKLYEPSEIFAPETLERYVI